MIVTWKAYGNQPPPHDATLSIAKVPLLLVAVPNLSLNYLRAMTSAKMLDDAKSLAKLFHN
jgi:hypothetical protein